MKQITAAWLQAASDDLLLVEEIISKETLTHIAAFHVQQALEKSLKAVIEEIGIETPKIHKLMTLFRISQKTLDSDDDLKTVRLLDIMYIEARYPGDMGLLPDGKPSLDESRKFYIFARKIYNHILNDLQR